MSPESSEGGPLDKDRPTAENTAAAKQKVPSQRTTRRPVAASRHVLAQTFRVTARSGRQRLVLLVERCPYCGCCHAHQAPVGFDLAKRAAGCGAGKYVVVALAQAVAA